jgi:hypothetical protein
MRTNKNLSEKCKTFGRETFVKIGSMAVGNSTGDKRGNTGVTPFSLAGFWPEERPMPKRKK